MAFSEKELLLLVSKRLSALLRDSNKKAKDLADSLNISAAYVSRILSGEANLTLPFFYKICEFLEVVPKAILPTLFKIPDNPILFETANIFTKTTLNNALNLLLENEKKCSMKKNCSLFGSDMLQIEQLRKHLLLQKDYSQQDILADIEFQKRRLENFNSSIISYYEMISATGLDIFISDNEINERIKEKQLQHIINLAKSLPDRFFLGINKKHLINDEYTIIDNIYLMINSSACFIGFDDYKTIKIFSDQFSNSWYSSDVLKDNESIEYLEKILNKLHCKETIVSLKGVKDFLEFNILEHSYTPDEEIVPIGATENTLQTDEIFFSTTEIDITDDLNLPYKQNIVISDESNNSENLIICALPDNNNLDFSVINQEKEEIILSEKQKNGKFVFEKLRDTIIKGIINEGWKIKIKIKNG